MGVTSLAPIDEEGKVLSRPTLVSTSCFFPECTSVFSPSTATLVTKSMVILPGRVYLSCSFYS